MAFNRWIFAAAVCLAASPLSVAGLPQGVQNQRFEPVTEVCLGCICESISTCDRNLRCEGDVCGMFGITWAYWADSGKPVLQGDNPNDGQAYPRCANDPTCARQSVVNYLTRFAQDCNRDGVIDCADYAAIHKNGGYGCSGYLDPNYKNKYDTCQRSVFELSGSSQVQNNNVQFQQGQQQQQQQQQLQQQQLQ
ncbi:Destabilase,EF-Hand 1, calcium-binding site [Cinara cedri]|uniref:lysozyme n=1 Tax=Cinara cedri TaxID=506608 RepID=A0A5E4MGT4_9HEMI|nr:Destabilase,EF-Hand 1, calcium-binding site [Cinara cedri]